MLEQLPLLLAKPIATAILNKFYEGVGSELAKKAVAELPAAVKTKVQQLSQFVWEKCLRGKPGTEKLLQDAAESTPTAASAQQQLTEYLYKVLEGDATLKQEVKKLADEIHVEITNDFSGMTQINRDQSTGYQTKTGDNNTNFFGGTHHHAKP